MGIMSVVAAVLWVLGTVLYHVAAQGISPDQRTPTQVTDAIAAVSALASLALFFYTRRDDRDPRFMLNLGLVYLVLTGLALGLIAHWYPAPGERPMIPTITWIGAVVLMSAAIVPNSPLKMLVAGFIAVSMNPLGMLIAKARGVWDFGPASNVLVMHYPDYMLLGVAVVISHVLTRLGHQVTKAREMGSYRLLSMLGKGGMGEVWRARHRMLARDAAIKLIQPDMLRVDSGRNAVLMRRRFEQEAKATAVLRSPHTVELYDFGVTDDGVFYYVMELLDGIDLETLVKKFGPQNPARIAHILRQVCGSLGDAHRHGMIHRDIKATNIFLCRMGNEYDFVKVLDFGLVKVQGSNETQMTLVGAATGTPAFMAPELALGRRDIDGRTDFYGLGCVAYWLATGKLVFEENGASATMLAHLNKAPIRPSERVGTSVAPSLERVIMMCLEKDPAKRPANAETFGRLLDRCNDVGSWTAVEAEGWWRSNMPDGAVSIAEQPTQTAASAFTTV